MLSSRVEVSVSGPPRRYYTISDEGRGALQAWREVWGELRTFVDSLTEPSNSKTETGNG
jgi:PadR family transcriptional regulator PadR